MKQRLKVKHYKSGLSSQYYNNLNHRWAYNNICSRHFTISTPQGKLNNKKNRNYFQGKRSRNDVVGWETIRFIISRNQNLIFFKLYVPHHKLLLLKLRIQILNWNLKYPTQMIQRTQINQIQDLVISLLIKINFLVLNLKHLISMRILDLIMNILDNNLQIIMLKELILILLNH